MADSPIISVLTEHLHRYFPGAARAEKETTTEVGENCGRESASVPVKMEMKFVFQRPEKR